MPGLPSTAARGHSRPILAAIGLVMLLTAIALGVVYRQVAITEMTDRGARDHAALVQALGRGLWSALEPFVQSPRGKPASELARHPGLPGLHQRISDEISRIPGANGAPSVNESGV